MISARNSLILLLCTMSACAWRQEPQVSSAQRDACRARADEVFLKQNPNERYRSDLYVSSQRDTPYGGTGTYDPTAALTARYTRDRLLDDCLRNANTAPAEPVIINAPAQPAPAVKPAQAAPTVKP